MGWWKVQDTEDIVGDDVFGILRTATEEIANLYRQEWGRCPSRLEWQHLIFDALLPLEDLEAPETLSLFVEGTAPHKVEIVLAPESSGKG